MSASTSPAGLSVFDGICMMVGLIVGIGIFRAPCSVAGQTTAPETMMSAWLLGGAIVACGALCYAQLARSYPDSGGEYSYLRASFGPFVSFLFAWGRVTVLQTGSLAATVYIFGDYAGKLYSMGAYSPMIYALAAAVILTTINILGLRLSKWTQNLLILLKVLGLVMIVGAALLARGEPAVQTAHASPAPAFGLAMVFVLYTYGGWNEAAYLTEDVHRGPVGLAVVLGISVAVVTVTYAAVNMAYLHALGFEGLRASTVPASDVLAAAVGPVGAVLVALLTCVAALSNANASVFTGCRVIHALGTRHAALRWLSARHPRRHTQVSALFVQGAVAVALVLFAGLLGRQGRHGFEVAVEYTAPAFWGFMLLVALTAVSRAAPAHTHSRKVMPLALLPASVVFVGMCGYMLYSSLAYTGLGALVGVAIVAAGVPVYGLVRRRDARAEGGMSPAK